MTLPRVQFDKSAATLYIQLDSQPIMKTFEYDDITVIVDHGPDGKIVGIELVGVDFDR